MKRRTGASSLWVITFLILSVAPRLAYAEPGARAGGGHIRLYGIAEVGPVGIVESMGAVSVNGRSVNGRRPVWNGDVVEAPGDGAACILLDMVGRVTLPEGAAVRLATTCAKNDDGTDLRLLMASVLSGAILVNLQREAGAHVQARGSVFTASCGSSFRVDVRRGHALVDTIVGVVRAEAQATQHRYVVRPVGTGASISVRARSTRQIQVRVTDENDKPVPDLPILFALGGKGVGSLGPGLTPRVTFTATTDSQGIATTNFTAGDSPGSDTISATVEGTRFSWIGQITVMKAGAGFWTARNTLLVIAGAAGAAAASAIVATRGGREPIRAVLPPKVQP